MLKGLTNTFKNNCNKTELTYREYIVINNQQIPVRAKLSDDSYVNGNFIGSFILKTIRFETSNDIDFKGKEFEYYKEVDGESIKIGTFITTEVEDNDTTEIVRVVGMDYGLKTQVEYVSQLNYSSGEITLLDVWDEACELSGIESGVEHFENDDFIVDSDQFTGTGAMIRDVFIGIGLSSGNFIEVMNDDKIYPIFAENTDEVIEDYTELEDKRDTHPWTCVRLGVSNIEGENVDLIDEELVEEYGENWLIINDNPFAYNQNKREQLITAIFNKVKGFGYSSFVSKTSFKPYLTCGDKVKFRNKNGDLIDSILLRYTHEFKEDDLQITLEAPSETNATVKYIYPLSAIDIAKRTEVVVDKENVEIELITERTRNLEDELNNNHYTIEQTNLLVQTAETGVTNTFSEAGGNNIFRNTGLWFENSGNDSAINPYEFWNGNVVKQSEEKAINFNSLLLQSGTLYQEQIVPNRYYTISFKYKRLLELGTAKCIINDIEYPLTEMTEKEFVQVIEVAHENIKIQFVSDTNNNCKIYDLMVNVGRVKLAYSQNQNETNTETVNISKGITITSSNMSTVFKSNADGTRVYNNNDMENPVTKLTDKGTETNYLKVRDEAEIVDILIQRVGNHTWMTKI